jgi:DNA-binding CsgD family transcriptional regulator
VTHITPVGRSHTIEGLTERQQEIYDRLQQHMKPQQIADDLEISRNAVYQHITSLKKAGVLEGQQRAAALGEDVFGSVAAVVTRAERRVAEITEQETRLAQEKQQLEAFIERNRDLLPA